MSKALKKSFHNEDKLSVLDEAYLYCANEFISALFATILL